MQEDIDRGSTISFGQMNLMPAITIQGRDYGIAYENMTEEHIKGIPVRIEGRTIGYVESLKDGTATLRLNEGETLDLAPEPQTTFSLGHVAMVGTDKPFVQETAKKGYYDGVRRLNDDIDSVEAFVTITRPSQSAAYLEFKRTKPRPANIDSDQYFEVQPVVQVVRRAGTGHHLVLATDPLTGLGDIEIDVMADRAAGN